MIARVQEVVTENPPREIWKRLRYFLDVSAVSDIIRRRQELPAGRFVADVKKQARQLGYSILQAEEYFAASEHVSLPTRPLLLYYGAISLGRALILLARDGTHSYDALRASNRHQHHGLELSRALVGSQGIASSANEFLGSISCSVKRNPKGEPWGHFPLFYGALSPSVFQYTKETHDDFRGASILRSLEPMYGPDMLPLESVAGQRLLLLDMVRALPDLYFTLRDYDIAPLLARGNTKMREERIHDANPDGSKTLSRIRDSWDFFIDGIDLSAKAALLASYQSASPELKVITDYGHNLHLRLDIERASTETFPDYYFPDIVEDANCRIFYALDPGKYLVEPASHLAILFCLGMVSRYYPDIWIRCTQENVRLAEIIDSILNLTYRRFPNLILDQMTDVKHYVHT